MRHKGQGVQPSIGEPLGGQGGAGRWLLRERGLQGGLLQGLLRLALQQGLWGGLKLGLRCNAQRSAAALYTGGLLRGDAKGHLQGKVIPPLQLLRLHTPCSSSAEGGRRHIQAL